MYAGAFVSPPYRQTGVRLYLRSDFATLLPPKGKHWEQFRSLLQFGDRLPDGRCRYSWNTSPRLMKKPLN